MASGVSLGESLAHNSALIELRLAHNSLAEPGIQAVSYVHIYAFTWHLGYCFDRVTGDNSLRFQPSRMIIQAV